MIIYTTKLSNENKRARYEYAHSVCITPFIKTYTDETKSQCYVRILSYIDGKIFANCKHSSKLEFSLGSLIIEKHFTLDKSFSNFSQRFLACPSPATGFTIMNVLGFMKK